MKKQYEELMRNIHGDNWKDLDGPDMDGVKGTLIVRSVLDGVKPKLYDISHHLGMESSDLARAFNNLQQNQAFYRLSDDRHCLDASDTLAWCYYAGYASGATQYGCN